ncbi:DUF4294 domain-containing protein [Prevotellamassilia timonensis]|uniref:DUF4294 domain-containing protein n=1 Tax=Prevotellamassilia timonensis TaxID=1852370 RepID=UPI00307AB723
MLHKIVVMLFMLFAPCAPMLAQQPTDDAGKQNTEVEEVEVPIMTQMGTVQYKGKTIPHIIMPALPKYAPLTFKNDRERAEYNRLVYNVKKVLPWAKLAKLTIIETVEVLDQLPDKRSRDAHIKEVERGLKAQYGPALKKLTRSQGRLLIKLVNRECNQTGYAIAKAFIGPFKANLYQGIAVLFGNSLNKKYDPDGDDRYTERVVRMVEAGLI